MLNLFDPISIPGVDYVQVYHDDADDHLFYMVPEYPTITRASSTAGGTDAAPLFSLIVIGRDFRLAETPSVPLSDTETEYGLVSMTTELSVTDEDQDKIRQALQNPPPGIRPVADGAGGFRFEPRAAPSPDRPIRLSYPV